MSTMNATRTMSATAHRRRHAVNTVVPFGMQTIIATPIFFQGWTGQSLS